jgi:hypothetical protein
LLNLFLPDTNKKNIFGFYSFSSALKFYKHKHGHISIWTVNTHLQNLQCESQRLQWYMVSFVNYTMMSYPVTSIYMSNTHKLIGILHSYHTP